MSSVSTFVMSYPLPLPRIHSRKHPRVDACVVNNTCATDHNSPPARRGLLFPVPAGCTTKKAPPTLSISNTNVSRSGASPVAFPNDVPEQTPHSVIPFPSAPIDFPMRRTDREDDFDRCPEPERHDGGEEKLPTGDKVEIRRDIDWRRIRRRCTQSCIASSHVPRDYPAAAISEEPRRPLTTVPVNRQSEVSAPDVKVDLNISPCRTRRHSVSAGCGPFRPTPRRTRKAKKLTVDTQFLSVVHRSIAWHARGLREYRNTGELDVCIEQDVELATRLWRVLAGRGCRPAPLKPGAPSPTFSAGSIAHTLHVSRSIDESAMDELADARSTSSVSKIPVQLGPSSAPSVLTMPQLVASMTLRFRDRTSVRPRSPICLTSKVGDELVDKPLRPRSALGHVAFLGGEGEEAVGVD
ncbi:hypothetical protein DAEQUDRAFT_729973 [Daedalea quercina L-15889]|uniref:Uncharacterized protein n=1 Tax=Daedalea quercina L-15889 TaxID=1314783 RepID=A0A165N9H3_9APHY|nr:hypothetical protein DAEQUDRAFT_729973 [Daedalea quercina L-15889]